MCLVPFKLILLNTMPLKILLLSSEISLSSSLIPLLPDELSLGHFSLNGSA
nr:hypothetical protein [Mycoplasmopsis bovis]